MIEDYSFGSIIIDGKSYDSDVIIYPDRVEGFWWRKRGHRLLLEDIAEGLESAPEVLIVGCGASSMLRITNEVKQELDRRRIELIATDTAEACRIHNQFRGKERLVTCLHLTC